jgi:hypothetical protein
MGLKRQFGSLLTRIIGGGATLYPAEHALLEAAVAALPPDLRGTVDAQFEAYNLVQREVGGRALNFYRKARGAVSSEGLPLLALKLPEAPLVRLTARVAGGALPVHAVLTAVGGRAFSLTTDRALEPREREGSVQIEHVVNSWKGNIDLRAEA